LSSEDSIWPNFFLVGAAKAGTTSLYHHLKSHPQVFVPERKEPNYFATPPPPDEPLLDTGWCCTLDEYQSLYRGGRGIAAIGDLSTSYLSDEFAPRRIHEACPNAKIIIMLRDPVIRAHSYYLMHLRMGGESAPTFWEALERDKHRNKTSWFTSWQYVEAGLYYEQVRRYVDTFGSGQVLIRLFDDLTKNPEELFQDIAGHLGIDPAPFHEVNLQEAHNAFKMPRFRSLYQVARSDLSRKLREKLFPEALQVWLRTSPLLYGRKKPPLDDTSRRYLQEIYDPDITLLEELLGRPLPELRKSWI
jgi:hypothetical protein